MTGHRLGKWQRIGTALAAAAVFGASAASARVNVKLNLTPTSKAPAAKGKAQLSLRTAAKGKFAITARRLPGGKTFSLMVGGVKVASLQSTPGGTAKAKFNTTPRHADLPLGFDPRGDQVVVREDDTGDDDLVGDVPDDSDPSAGACCVPDHEGETECEDLTADACTQAGGTPQAVASCLPDPCSSSSTPPESDGVLCCIPGSAQGAFVEEDPEVECEDVSQADCAAAGGTVILAGSCDANPCGATTPAQEIVCCVPNGAESECETVSAEVCSALGGTPNAATSCSGDPCGGGGGSGN